MGRNVVPKNGCGKASKKIANLKRLSTNFKAKREKGVGTPFPSVSTPLPVPN